MTTTETNLQRDAREMTESQARLRAEMAKSPQFVAMSEAMKLTKVETEDLAKAEVAVTEAEQVVGQIAGQIQALRNGRTTKREFITPDGRPLIQRLLDPKKAEAAAKELPELEHDLQGARGVLQAANRKRNRVLSALNAARMLRRQAAKARHAPPRPPVQSHGDWWASVDRIGRKDAS